MPIYEYQCEKCGRVLNFLVRSVADHRPPACPKCGHAKMARVLSRFAAPGKCQSTKEESDSPAPAADLPPGMDGLMAGVEGLDENNPREMGRFMRKMAEETGEPMPAEMHEIVRRLESGEDPEKIEADMGDLADDESGGGAGGAAGADTLYDG